METSTGPRKAVEICPVQAGTDRVAERSSEWIAPETSLSFMTSRDNRMDHGLNLPSSRGRTEICTEQRFMVGPMMTE